MPNAHELTRLISGLSYDLHAIEKENFCIYLNDNTLFGTRVFIFLKASYMRMSLMIKITNNFLFSFQFRNTPILSFAKRKLIVINQLRAYIPLSYVSYQAVGKKKSGNHN